MRTTLAQRIRWVIKFRDISARELSRRAGLNEIHLAKYFARAEQDPSATLEPKTISALARAADVNAVWLETGHGEAESKRKAASRARRDSLTTLLRNADPASSRAAIDAARAFLIDSAEATHKKGSLNETTEMVDKSMRAMLRAVCGLAPEVSTAAELLHSKPRDSFARAIEIAGSLLGAAVPDDAKR